MANSEVKLLITSDATSAVAGMKKTSDAMRKMEGDSRGIMGAIGNHWKSLATLAAGIGFVSMAKSALESMDNVAKMSQKVGVGAETLQAFAYAGKLSGIEMDQMSVGLGKLAKSAYTGSDTFAALGISVKDSGGHLKTTEQLVGEVADKFSGMKDSAGKTAIAMELFGKSGKDMIPFLNEGAKGIAALTQEARDLGLVLDAETIKQAERVKDNFERLEMVAGGLAKRIMSGMLPAFESITETFIEAAKRGDDVRGVAENMGTALKALAAVAIGVAASFDLAFEAGKWLFTKAPTEVGKGWANLGAAYTPGLQKEMEALTKQAPTDGTFEKRIQFWGTMLNKLWEPAKGGLATPRKRSGEAPDPVDSKKAADGLATLARAQAEWAKRIEQMNPLLDEETKKLEGFYDAVEMTRMSLEKDKLPTSWLDSILSKGEGLIKLAHGLKEVQATNEALAKWEEDKAADTFARTLMGADQSKRIADLSITRHANLLALRSHTGDLSPREVTEQGFALDRQGLETASRRLAIELEARRITALKPEEQRAVLALEYEEIALKQQILNLDELSAASLAQYSRTLNEGLVAGLRMYADELSRHFDQGVELARNAAQEMERGFSDIFFDGMTGKLKTAEDYWRAFLNSIARMMSDLIAKDLMAGILKIGDKGGSSGGWLSQAISFGADLLGYGAGRGTGMAPGYDMGSPYSYMDLPDWHKGGPVRILHGGGYPLNADEVPAILQMDEYVIRRDAARRIGTPTLDALNQGRVPGTTSNTSINVPIVINGEASRALEVRLRRELEKTAQRVMKEAM